MANSPTNTSIGDYVALQRGNTYKSALLGGRGPYLLGLGSIARNGGFKANNLKRYGGPSDPKILLRPGDIYVSLKDVTQSADLLGAVARVPEFIESGRLTQDTVKLVFKKHQSLPDYIYWLLRTPEYREYCKAHATGTTNLGLSRDDFFAFPVPALTPERAVVVDLLQALEDKIELNRRMNETLEVMARAIFKDWFVDFGPTRAKMEGRPPYLAPDTWSLFPDRLDDDDKPNGWRFVVLEEILDEIETGGRPKGGVSGYAVGIPSVGAESIVGLGQFDYSKTKYIPQEFFKTMNKGHVESRDVLLYKDGGRPGQFEPHLTLVGDGFPFDTFAINEHVYRLRAKTHFGQNLLYFWLSSDFVREEMRTKGTGVAIPGLNSTQVKSLGTLVPTPQVAAAFDTFANPAVTRILANCNESRILAQTRDLLLPKLMSGEIRVRDAEKMVEATL